MSLETSKSWPIGAESVQTTAYALARYLDQEKNLITQTMRTNSGYIIQSKGDASYEWTKYLGLDAALTVSLEESNGTLKATVGSGKWIEKAGIGLAGGIFFPPLAWTAGIGAARTAILYNDVFNFISTFLNAEPIKEEPQDVETRTVQAETLKDITCPKCGAVNHGDALYCTHCGAKLHEDKRHCTNCGAELGPDDLFCPQCGRKVE